MNVLSFGIMHSNWNALGGKFEPKSIKNEIEKLSIKPEKELNHGEIELKVNGITIRKTIR